MSRSIPKTARILCPIWNGLSRLRTGGGALDDYPSDNAMIVGTLLYALIFPKRHALTANLSRLPAAEQDLVHDFVAH